MPATIQFNRLVISAESDAEFVEHFQELFPRLLELDFEELECDLTRSRNLGEDSYRAIAMGLLELEDASRKLWLRIPERLEVYFRQSTLYRLATIDIVRRLESEIPIGKRTMKLIQKGIKRELAEHPAEKPSERHGEAGAAAPPPTKMRADSGHDVVVHDSHVFPHVESPAPHSPFGKVANPFSGADDVVTPRKYTPEDSHKTLVGLPRALMDDERPHTQQGADGVSELVIGGGDRGDLAELGESIYDRDPRAMPETRQAWLQDMTSGEVKALGDSIIVGREKPADWVIAAATISKQHFRVFRQKGRYFIEDLKATNGTFVAGEEVKTRAVPLKAGDAIVVAITLKHPKGARAFTFLVRDPFGASL